jgi:hypothetical protein
MSGHSRWWKSGDPVTMPKIIMSQHIQGYILAMEDILRDIESMQYDAEDADPEYVAGHGAALDLLKHRAEESRDSARRTLDAITKKVDAAQ